MGTRCAAKADSDLAPRGHPYRRSHGDSLGQLENRGQDLHRGVYTVGGEGRVSGSGGDRTAVSLLPVPGRAVDGRLPAGHGLAVPARLGEVRTTDHTRTHKHDAAALL